MVYVLATLLLLGVLVAVHELGHYCIARWMGVKVEVFSIGFGPKLLRKQMGETEFVISAIPFGGYVKMLGSDFSQHLNPEEAKRGYFTQPPHKKIAIALGGPIANILFTVFGFALLAWIGQYHLAPEVGSIFEGTLAHTMGFRTHDHILAINDQPIAHGEEIAKLLQPLSGKVVTFRIERSIRGKPETVDITTTAEKQYGLTPHGEVTWEGTVPGLTLMIHQPTIAVLGSTSWAATTGIQTNDTITAVGKTPVTSLDALWPVLKHQIDRKTLSSLTIERGEKSLILPATPPSPSPRTLHDLGLAPAELAIGQVQHRSAAEASDLRKGDVILEANGLTQTHFSQFRSLVQDSGAKGQPMQLIIQRGESRLHVQTTPRKILETEDGNPAERKNYPYVVGIMPTLHVDTARVLIAAPHIGVAAVSGITQTWEWSVRFATGLAKLVTGHMSVKSLAGPIYIGKMAGEWFQEGLRQFLFLMTIISLNLGLINLVPIPILDGGHILLFTIEGILRRPLAEKWVARFFQVGLALILLLTVFVIYNDLLRILK